MGTSAVIPAAPVLLDHIDHSEPSRMAQLRDSIRQVLLTQDSWALPVTTLPPVAGLGGWGIDRGIVTATGRMLTGDEWVETVGSLTPAERRIAEATDPAIIVALLHAHAAGVAVGPIGSSENLLLPLDLSGAATDNAPLAPVDGAADFDAELVDALTADALSIDVGRVLELCSQAPAFHADLTAVDAGIRHLISENAFLSPFDFVFDEPVHEVRSVCGTTTWAQVDDE